MKKLNILVIGGGGREHALGWKLKQSASVNKLFFAPGNPGTAVLGENVSLSVKEIHKLSDWAIEHQIDFTIVGPDDPLALGIVNVFQEKKQVIFGPTKEAARIEWSKEWASHFLDTYKVPQPVSKTFTSAAEAKKYIKSGTLEKLVVKADGLALGKGVLLPESIEEAFDAVDRIMVQKEFGDAGNALIIQEKLIGHEVSFFALSDGTNVVSLISLQDHKQIFDGDKGPNTGGMGTYSPVPFMNTALNEEILDTIIQPVVNGMKKEGHPYTGVLYAGLMITNTGPKVLEFNARFGDPETQTMMVLLESDLVELLYAASTNNLVHKKAKFADAAGACIVLASKGYPESPKKGDVIHGLNSVKDTDVVIFHAGTTKKENDILTNGGRVLNVVAKSKTLQEALQKAYAVIGHDSIHFEGMQYRKDIGAKTLT